MCLSIRSKENKNAYHNVVLDNDDKVTSMWHPALILLVVWTSSSWILTETQTEEMTLRIKWDLEMICLWCTQLDLYFQISSVTHSSLDSAFNTVKLKLLIDYWSPLGIRMFCPQSLSLSPSSKQEEKLSVLSELINKLSFWQTADSALITREWRMNCDNN